MEGVRFDVTDASEAEILRGEVSSDAKNMSEATSGWRAIITYHTDREPLDVEHNFDEIAARHRSIMR